MSVRVPKYRLHKGTGQALVQIDGRRIYLGKHGTERSRQKYRRDHRRVARQRQTNPTPPGTGLPAICRSMKSSWRIGNSP